MQLSASHLYKHKELKAFLQICPICGMSDELAVWSSMADASVAKGKEGITCSRCKLDLSFSFKMDQNSEIIDEYVLDFFKIGQLEFKNNDKQLVLYLNNTYVKDVDNNTVDIDKCKTLVILS